tara:strand:+ start:148 stop:525 length:378 start_codon:yes stop_codon:yes gene_type:complete
MNVRITETVALEDVPEKVSKMIDEAKLLLIGDLFNFDLVKRSIVSHMTFDSDSNFMLAEISKIRQDLAKVDAKLEDCVGIIQGFENIVASAQQEDVVTNAPEVMESDDSFTVENKEEEKNDRPID